MFLLKYFVIFSLLLIIVNCMHTAKNNSDVIVTYSGHAEANLESEYVPQNTSSSHPEDIAPPDDITTTTETTTPTTKKLNIFVPEYVIREMSSTTTEYEIPEEEDDVIFVPNEKPVSRYGDEFPSKNKVRVQELFQKSVDVIGDKKIRLETEPPKDIFFISGKNNENLEVTTKPKKTETRMNSRRRMKEPEIVLDCKNLDCNNTIASVCGGKVERSEWKYRHFLNDCYFRKVNCYFKYAENHYKRVTIDKCKHIGAHFQRKSLVFNPAPIPILSEPVKINIPSRRYISRRAISKDIDGQPCDHSCPTTCPEDYEPECAFSPTGNRRVFLNHCKMDLNSCTFSVVWYQRPLAECVGGKKAEMRQNRAFIGWMQKVGIVDKKGRLVLS